MMKFEYYTEGENATTTINNTSYTKGQSFTIGVSGPNAGFIFTKVRLKLRSGTAPTLYLALSTTDGGGLPTETLISTGEIAGADIIDNEYNDIAMSSVTLTKDTKYALLIKVSGGSVGWRANTSGTYAGGGADNKPVDTWFESAGTDYMFEIWGEYPQCMTMTGFMHF